MSLAFTKYGNLFKATRFIDWRYSFIPQIFGNLYLWLILFEITISANSIVLLFLSLVTSFGFAALGYFINEFFDQHDDAKAGKQNKLALITSYHKLLLFVCICLVTTLPWLFLKHTPVSFLLIAIQVLLFVVYAAPPFRFKKKSYAAVVTDSLYAYVVPLLLSFYTYSLYSTPIHHNNTFITLYALLMMLAGIRNIIVHYINDIFKDKQIGHYTIPRIIGVVNTNKLLKAIITTEIIIALIVYIKLISVNKTFVIALLPLIYLSYNYALKLKHLKNGIMVNNAIRHTPDLLYQYYQPVVMLCVLVISSTQWIVLAPIHLLLFVPFFRFHPFISWVQRINFRLYFIWLKQISSWIVNYTIFFSFLLIGVNLRRRQLSALGYIKQKFGLVK